MSDTTLLQKPETNGKDSAFFGVSIRAWLAFIPVSCVALNQLIVVVGVTIDAVIQKDWSKVGTFANIGEPLYGMTIASMAFYFGQKTAKTV